MYEYRLKTPDKATAQMLAQAFGIEWDGQQKNITQYTPMNDGSTRRMDVVVLGDLPQQAADGRIITTTQEVDGEDVDVPVMTGKYHIDVISTHRIVHAGANAYEVQPKHPLHRWL